MRCIFGGYEGPGTEVWGPYTCRKLYIEHDLVSFCRKAFKKCGQDQLNRYWVFPGYFDDTYYLYNHRFFKEIGAVLFPRLSKTPNKGIFIDSTGFFDRMSYRDAVWEAAHNDFDEHMRRGTKPIFVVVRAVRIPDKEHAAKWGITKYCPIEEKILSVTQVEKLPGVMLSRRAWRRAYEEGYGSAWKEDAEPQPKSSAGKKPSKPKKGKKETGGYGKEKKKETSKERKPSSSSAKGAKSGTLASGKRN